MFTERNGQISLFFKIPITFLNMSLGTQDNQTRYASSSTCNLVLSLHLRWNQPHDLLWRQFSSVTQSCPTLCNPMDCSTPGLPVHHQLPEFTQTHVHWVGDAIQPFHPLSSPSPAFNLSQHQGLLSDGCFRDCCSVIFLRNYGCKWILDEQNFGIPSFHICTKNRGIAPPF